MDDDIIQVSAIMYFFYCQVQYHKLEVYNFYPFLTTESLFSGDDLFILSTYWRLDTEYPSR